MREELLTLEELDIVFSDMEKYFSLPNAEIYLIKRSVVHHIQEGNLVGRDYMLSGDTQVGPTGGPYIYDV